MKTSTKHSPTDQTKEECCYQTETKALLQQITIFGPKPMENIATRVEYSSTKKGPLRSQRHSFHI
jgi:hypothetical protein